jgi:uncharacterized membrane protein YhaH (DUF805 family)
MFKFFCVKCGSKLSADSEKSGLMAVCPSCGGTIQVPTFCDHVIANQPTKPPPLPVSSLMQSESGVASMERKFGVNTARKVEAFTEISWWFSFSGFVGRLAFFQATIIRLSIILLVGILPALFIGETGLFALAVIWPFIVWSNVSFMARRMRDVGESPWVAILGVIPFAATAFGFVCFFWPTKKKF